MKRVTILSGDGSRWLSDLQSENDMDNPKRHISNHRQTAGFARQQQQMNRLQHARWAHEMATPRLSWQAAVLLGLMFASIFAFV